MSSSLCRALHGRCVVVVGMIVLVVPVVFDVVLVLVLAIVIVVLPNCSYQGSVMWPLFLGSAFTPF